MWSGIGLIPIGTSLRVTLLTGASGEGRSPMVPDYPRLIVEEVAVLERLERSQRHGLAGDRVRFLRLLKSGQAANVSRAAPLVGYAVRTVQEW